MSEERNQNLKENKRNYLIAKQRFYYFYVRFKR